MKSNLLDHDIPLFFKDIDTVGRFRFTARFDRADHQAQSGGPKAKPQAIANANGLGGGDL
jgi:hypothetical protein